MEIKVKGKEKASYWQDTDKTRYKAKYTKNYFKFVGACHTFN